jgi:hypothetical protein
VAVERLAREDVEADAADPRRRAGEVPVDEVALEADGLEDLGAAVGLGRRDPHLGDRLEQALAERLDDVLLASATSCTSPVRSSTTSSSTESKSRYGLIALAP